MSKDAEVDSIALPVHLGTKDKSPPAKTFQIKSNMHLRKKVPPMRSFHNDVLVLEQEDPHNEDNTLT